MPDPKLKEAMGEILAILKKHDIVANVLLSSDHHVEFLRHVDASWTALKVQRIGEFDAVRFRCKRADYPDAETFMRTMTSTVGCLAGFIDAMTNDLAAYKALLAEVGQRVDIRHISIEEDNKGN